MSKADQLAAKLKQTQHSSADATLCADHQIDSWPAQVYELYQLVETWLAPLSEAGLNIRRVPTHVFERHPDGATYDYAIDQLLIEGNHHSITFDPVARFTEDGAGRVEIRTQAKALSMLRTVSEHGETQWWLQAIDQSGQQPDAIAMTEDTLLSAVQEGLQL